MKKSIQLLVCSVFLLSTIANAQWSKNRIKGNGKVVSNNRSTAGYDGIKVSGFFDVDLVSGKEGTITVKAEENLQQYIKVQVEGNVLKIYTEKNANISPGIGKTIQITIPFEKISNVSLSGSGDVRSKSIIKSDAFTAALSGSGNLNLDVDATTFDLAVSGSGDIVLKGNTGSLTTKLSGSGDIDAASLKAKNVDITISGSGDSKVFCSENLKARVSGSGDIEYKGDPKTRDTKVSGSGNISKA
ncbi:MAG: head GIN domain-containing protein [Flavobacterium sp.]